MANQLNFVLNRVYVKAKEVGTGRKIQGYLVNQIDFVDNYDENDQLINREVQRDTHSIMVVDRDKKGKALGVSVHEIDPDTLCESVGMADVDGKTLFNGDTVLLLEDSGKAKAGNEFEISRNTTELGYFLGGRYKLTDNKKVRFVKDKL